MQKEELFMEKKKKLSLPAQIFIALVLGIVVGLIFYFAGAADFTTNYVKPFGDIFVNLLKFIVCLLYTSPSPRDRG